MKFELIYDIERLILYYVEIRVIAVTRYIVTVLAIPLCVFYTDVLRWYHLAVEQNLLRTILFVEFLDNREDTLYEFLILLIWSDFQPHELCSLYQSVHTYGQILTRHIDVTGIEEWQHAMFLQILQVLIVSQLNFMTKVYNLFQILLVVTTVIYGKLHTAVDIDC